MNTMMRSSAIYGTLLCALLAGAWLDWTAVPAIELDGKVVLVPGEVEELTRITWSSKNKDDVVVERKDDAMGVYYDVTYTRWTEDKSPAPEVTPEGEAPAEAPATEPTFTSTTTHFKAGDSGDELFKSMAPLLALRKLTDLTPDKLETTGLQDPQDKLVLERRGKSIALEVGGEVYGTKDRYVRDVASGDVYLVDDEVLRSLRYARTRLPDRTVFSMEEKRVAKVTIGTATGSVEVLHKNALDEEKAAWVRASAPETPDEQLQTWLDKAIRLKSTAYAEAEDDVDGIVLQFSLIVEDEKGRTETLEVLRKPNDEKADYWARSEHTRGLVKLLRGQTNQLVEDVGAVLGE